MCHVDIALIPKLFAKGLSRCKRVENAFGVQGTKAFGPHLPPNSSWRIAKSSSFLPCVPRQGVWNFTRKLLRSTSRFGTPQEVSSRAYVAYSTTRIENSLSDNCQNKRYERLFGKSSKIIDRIPACEALTKLFSFH